MFSRKRKERNNGIATEAQRKRKWKTENGNSKKTGAVIAPDFCEESPESDGS
jgi:hypothetical protein